MDENSPLSAPLVMWAAELDIDDKTLREKLVAAGIVAKARQPLRAKDIFRAVSARGDYESNRARREAAEAQLREMKLATQQGLLLPRGDVEYVWSSAVEQARQILWQDSSVPEATRRRMLRALSGVKVDGIVGAASVGVDEKEDVA
jgi:phage terminase Nu1 subunit (DNA packaging protein)